MLSWCTKLRLIVFCCSPVTTLLGDELDLTAPKTSLRFQRVLAVEKKELRARLTAGPSSASLHDSRLSVCGGGLAQALISFCVEKLEIFCWNPKGGMQTPFSKTHIFILEGKPPEMHDAQLWSFWGTCTYSSECFTWRGRTMLMLSLQEEREMKLDCNVLQNEIQRHVSIYLSSQVCSEL